MLDSRLVLAVDWQAVGALGEWFGAIGTIAAVALSWFVFRREHNLTLESMKDERKQRDAELAASNAQVVASERQAALAAEAFRASLLPIVTAARVIRDSGVREHVTFDDPRFNEYMSPGQAHVNVGADHTACTLVLRNIGPGVAFLHGHGLTAGTYGWSGNMSSGVLAAGEDVRLKYLVPHDRPELGALRAAIGSGTFSAELSYSDVSGEQKVTARADVHRTGLEGTWVVRQLYLFKDGETDPFAWSGPAD